MLHLSKRVLTKAQILAVQNVRHQSQQQAAGKSGAGAAVAVAAGGAVAGIGGLLGYASWSNENRKTVDDVPGMKYITDAVLGAPPVPVTPKKAPPKPVTAPPSVAKPAPAQTKSPAADQPEEPKSVSPIMKKKMEREKKKEQEATEKRTEKTEAAVPAPAATPPPPPPTPVSEAVDSLKKDLGAVLAASAREANAGVTAALDAAERAAAVVQKQAVAIIESVDTGAIDDSVKASVGAAVAAAEEAFKQAQVKMAALATEIASSKSSGSADESAVGAAERTVSELGPAIVKVKEVVTNALNTMLNVELMVTSLKDARVQLAAEVKEVLPDLSEVDAEKQLKLLLGHAYNRIQLLQKQILEKQKTLEDLRARGPLEDSSGGISEAVLQAELDKLRHQLQLQHRSDLGRQQEELEAEVRGQLKRQAAAHSEHLSDMLARQEQEITTAWQLKLYDEINKEKDRHYRDVATVRAKLLGLQSAVLARAEADRAAHEARSLWLACQALRNAIRLGKEGATSWDDQLQPLKSHLTAISVSAGENEFVKSVLGSVSSEAAERGVCTEEALRHRFSRVLTVARRVALVPENGGSLLRYLLSYVQSLLLVQASYSATDAELLDQPIDVHKLTTFDILDRANACLTADDMLGCVRWLNQLTGESRRVAQDWKEEARRTLETRQAADALMAHAAATTATAL